MKASVCPRTVAAGDLEDSLLEAAQAAASCSGLIDLLPMAYDEAEHARVSASDPFHMIAIADGDDAKQARDTVFHGRFGRSVPRAGAQGSIQSMALAFDLGDAGSATGVGAPEVLNPVASTALSLAQSRFLLSWTGPRKGIMHVTLTDAEAEEALALAIGDRADRADDGSFRCCGVAAAATAGCEFAPPNDNSSLLWPRVQDGLRLFGIPEDAVYSIARLSSEKVDRPFFSTQLKGLQAPSGCLPSAFLLGDSAHEGTARFGPDLGQSASIDGAESLAATLVQSGCKSLCEGIALEAYVLTDHTTRMTYLREREREVGGLGVARRIELGLTGKGTASSSDAVEPFLNNVKASLLALQNEEFADEAAAAFPSQEALETFVSGAQLSEETCRVLCSSGPWAVEVNQVTSQEVEASVYDFGGETPAGLKQAKELRRAAKQGDNEAAFQLGVMYFTANGVKKDSARALDWMSRAAEGGHPQAMNCVGSMLRTGVGVPMDKLVALGWFQKAATLGDPEAQYNLGEMLHEGEGVEMDEERARHWLERSANKGIREAQFKLGMMLHMGDGVEPDRGNSVAWLVKAADQGLTEAMYMLGNFHCSGDGVIQDKVVASKYYTQAAELGDAMSQYSLGVMLELGDGIERDEVQSQFWLRKAAAQGMVDAQAACREQRLFADEKEAHKQQAQASRGS